MLYKSITKLTFFSIIMIATALVGLIIFGITFNDWIFYDNKYLLGNPDFILPVNVQVDRTLIVVSLIIYIFCALASLWEINKIQDKKIKKYYFLTGGLFVWLISPYTFYLAYQNKTYQNFWKYLKTKKEANEQINFYKLSSVLKNKKFDKVFWNTIIFIFLTVIAIVDFALIWLHQEYNPNDPNSNILFNTFSYFTQLTNFAIIIFICIFSFAHQTIIFRNNTLLILMTAYITIVGVMFWGYLLPFGNFKDEYSHLKTFIKTVWLHAVTPICFSVFAVNSFFISREKTNSFSHISIIGTVYPIFYAFFSYSLPFYTRHSVYGIITNLNPNMTNYYDNKRGDPLNFLLFFLIATIFYFFFFFFWKLAKIAHKKTLKNQKINLKNKL